MRHIAVDVRPIIIFAVLSLVLKPSWGAETVPADGADPHAGSRAELANQRVDLEALVTSATVERLHLAWKIKADDYVTHAPLLHRGAVIFADWSGNVYRADARSGELLWKKKIEEAENEWVWHGLAGTGTVGQGLLFEASVEGHAFALNPDSGEMLWKTRISKDPHAGNVGELLYHDGLLYIGLSSVEETLDGMIPDFEPDFCGEVIALEAATGKIAWRCPVVEPPHNGVGIWSGFAVDPELQALFFATSNNYTGKSSSMSDSLVAVNLKTGKVLWSRQVLAHDLWTRAEPLGPDYGFGAGPQLFEAQIDGQVRHLVGAGQKSGIYWVMDRRTGELVWSHPVGYGGPGGGIDAEASVSDSIYVWSNNLFDYDLPADQYPLTIKALDPATGDCRWVQPKAQPAAIPAAGFLTRDLYFVGSLDGKVRAYRTADGKCVWTSPADADAVATSLVIRADTLYFGTGVPEWYGGRHSGNAMLAYRIAPSSAAAP